MTTPDSRAGADVAPPGSPAVPGGDARACPYASAASTERGRRAFLRRLLAVALGLPATTIPAACGDDGTAGADRMGQGIPDWMMQGEGGMGGSMMRDMRVIRDLLAHHDQIQRRVDDVPGGVRTVTTSANGKIAELLQTHVGQMNQRVENGEAIRRMDPLFEEIFEHSTAIRMEVESVDGGVEVTETSGDPEVALLIRQHARSAVSEFVTDGMTRAMETTPLPEGYRE